MIRRAYFDVAVDVSQKSNLQTEFALNQWRRVLKKVIFLNSVQKLFCFERQFCQMFELFAVYWEQLNY